jgi:alkanesulfonate monooxygenase SsuD/methylene tetrahydromethanopterin reductase-like flavin-dependent oxidoreductase (luciferase family)
VADHFVDPFSPGDSWFEGWTLLSALAVRTSRIRIGTLVSSLPLRNPALLARQAITVDHISNGRLELGLGTGVGGETDPVYSMIGIDDWSNSERAARFEEAVEIVDQCLRNRVVTYDGKYYHIKGAMMYPPPIQQPRPPITIGAMRPRTLKLAARFADTWNSLGFDSNWDEPPAKMLENTRRRNELLDEYCDEIGRNPKTLRRSLLVVGTDAAEVFNSTDGFADVVSRYAEVGISEFIFYYPRQTDQLTVLESVAREIIPRLRAQN